ncbi:hypothetical protein F0U61_45125 [Archangium violaceum]|uniref:hypothetical protein n=1 Tax=Archangium violaceum TaxID=83451 RepID=UPI002B2B2BCE|nr:hypothetical protein F0U61_45125 [Archangium violaceum]
MKRFWMYGVVPFLLAGCGLQKEAESHTAVSEERALVQTPLIPKLFSYETTSGATAYAVELPQGEGRASRLARLNGCTEANARRLFRIYADPITLIRDSPWQGQLNDPSTLVLSCPDTTASGARVFVESLTLGSSYLEYSQGSGTDAGQPSSFLVIPNRCGELIFHFQVPQRAAQQETSREPPPATGERIYLSCKRDRPVEYSGWELNAAYVRSLDRYVYVLTRGASTVLLDAVDGLTVTDLQWDDAKRVEVQDRLRELFMIPDSVSSGWTGELKYQDVAGRPLFDFCVDHCGTDFKPAHKKVVDGAISCLQGELGTGESCTYATPFTYEERQQLDGTIRRGAQLSTGELVFPACGGATETWQKHLGFTHGTSTAASWLGEMKAAYGTGTPPSSSSPALALPCIQEQTTCRINLSQLILDEIDLSKLELSSELERAVRTRQCPSGPEALEVVIGPEAVLRDTPFRVDASTLPSSLKTLRIGGEAGARSVLLVAEPRCGTGAALCTAAVPAIQVEGDLEVELRYLDMRPIPPTTPVASRPALARVAVRARGGTGQKLMLRLRDADIGDATRTYPFYAGVDIAGGSLALYNSDVLAFTSAVEAEQGTVSIVSWPQTGQLKLVSLAHANPSSGILIDLDGRSLSGTVDRFRALTLKPGTQTFIGGATLQGPVGILWSGIPRPEGEDALWSKLTTFSKGLPSTSTLFRTEATMLRVRTAGRLVFDAASVSSFAYVVRCPAQASGEQALVQFVVPQPMTDIRYPKASPGACQLEAPWLGTP